MSTTDIKTLFDAGAHFGYPRARRHPTATSHLFGTKDSTDIFDLAGTQVRPDARGAVAGGRTVRGRPVDRGHSHEFQEHTETHRPASQTSTGTRNGRSRQIHQARTPAHRPQDRRAPPALRRAHEYERVAGRAFYR